METVACARKLIISMENHKHRANSTFDLLSCRRTKELLKQNQTLVSCLLEKSKSAELVDELKHLLRLFVLLRAQ